MIEKPFSAACERNKEAIFQQLTPWLQDNDLVLEVGSATAQHALYFVKQRPTLHWQCSEIPARLASLALCLSDQNNIIGEPIELDVDHYQWKRKQFNAIYTANTLHIMHKSQVYNFLSHAAQALFAQGYLFIYGPFRYKGKYTSESNYQFDGYLKARDPKSGIRDFELISDILTQEGFVLRLDHAMPANNQFMVWQLK